MLRFGPTDGPVVVVAMPLFEEWNRTRATMIAMARALSHRGIASAIPDLPGQGESSVPIQRTTLAGWRSAFAAAARAAGADRRVLAVRGGALVSGDGSASTRLHLAPVAGSALVRDLLRARRAASLAAGEPLKGDDPHAPGPPLLLAGNLVARELLHALMDVEPEVPDRLLRLFPSADLADRLLAPDAPPNADGDLPRFRAPWSAAEPGNNSALASLLADDIADWVRACAG